MHMHMHIDISNRRMEPHHASPRVYIVIDSIVAAFLADVHLGELPVREVSIVGGDSIYTCQELNAWPLCLR